MPQQLELHKVAGRIGAMSPAFRLSGDLSLEEVAEIRAAVLRHKVVFFRGQEWINTEEHERLARLFGKPTGHPTLGGQAVRAIDGSIPDERANVWHTDATFSPNVASLAFLRAEIVPAVGGDTMWANTAAAYADLPDPLRTLAEVLRAVHSNSYEDVRDTRTRGEAESAYGRTFASRLMRCEHPVVHVHPETGERCLLLGNAVRRFVGMKIGESQQLWSILQAYVIQPENIVRWSWRPGDIAAYDNRSTQHYAINDYGEAKRRMQTARLEGGPLTGIDGSQSLAY